MSRGHRGRGRYGDVVLPRSDRIRLGSWPGGLGFIGVIRGGGSGKGGRFVIRLSMVLACAAMVVGAPDPAGGCGISTHFQIARISTLDLDRGAYPALYDLLRDSHRKEFKVGACFPDWGYVFPATHDLGEEAHWPPFYYAAVDHVFETYPEPWDDHATSVYAFISGIGCHGAADDAWHFGDTAFRYVARDEDLPDWPMQRAEMAIEVLTDIFIQVERRWGFEDPVWYVPVGDMLAVYERLGFNGVTANDIVAGMTALHAGLILEDTIGWMIYLPGIALLPWTHGNHMDWWDGGVRNCAEMTALEVQAMWNYKESLYGRGANVAGIPDLSVEHGPRAAHRHAGPRMFRAAAVELITSGALEPRVEHLPDGVVRWDRPIVRDEARVLEVIDELRRSAFDGVAGPMALDRGRRP